MIAKPQVWKWSQKMPCQNFAVVKIQPKSLLYRSSRLCYVKMMRAEALALDVRYNVFMPSYSNVCTNTSCLDCMRTVSAAARAPSPVDWAERLGDNAKPKPNLSSIFFSLAASSHFSEAYLLIIGLKQSRINVQSLFMWREKLLQLKMTICH